MLFSQGTVNTQHGPREKVRSLTAREGQGAAAYSRLVAILPIAQKLLQEGKTASQHEIYNRCTCLCLWTCT
jgi:hypothetical protein